jgi:hypothetical protein
MERVDDGISKILAFRQIQSCQRNSPILGHVYVPFIGHVIALQIQGNLEHYALYVSTLSIALFTTLFRDL